MNWNYSKSYEIEFQLIKTHNSNNVNNNCECNDIKATFLIAYPMFMAENKGMEKFYQQS